MPNRFFSARIKLPVVGTYLNPASSEVRVVFDCGILYAAVKLFDAKQPSYTVKFLEPAKFADTLKWWRTVEYHINPERVREAYVILQKYVSTIKRIKV